MTTIADSPAAPTTAPDAPRGIRPEGRHRARFAAGDTLDVCFERNRRDGSPWRFRATSVGGERLDKAILSNDARITPGRPCRVVVTRVRKPAVPGRGYYEVRFRGPADLRLPDDVWVPELTRAFIADALEDGDNILLMGPQGSGKTVVTEAIAYAMGFTYVYANASSTVDETDFVATMQLKASSSGATETVWVPSVMLEAIRRATADPAARELVFLDELNRCREQARNGLMSALDATRRIYDPTTGGYRRIPPNVQFVAAVNVGTPFTGTTPIDAAQLDRFAPVHVTYPPRRVERAMIAAKVPRASRGTIGMVLRIAGAIRGEADILGGASVRATIDATKRLSNPVTRQHGRRGVLLGLKDAFCGRLDGVWADPATDAGRAWVLIKRLVAGSESASDGESDAT